MKETEIKGRGRELILGSRKERDSGLVNKRTDESRQRENSENGE